MTGLGLLLVAVPVVGLVLVEVVEERRGALGIGTKRGRGSDIF